LAPALQSQRKEPRMSARHRLGHHRRGRWRRRPRGRPEQRRPRSAPRRVKPSRTSTSTSGKPPRREQSAGVGPGPGGQRFGVVLPFSNEGSDRSQVCHAQQVSALVASNARGSWADDGRPGHSLIDPNQASREPERDARRSSGASVSRLNSATLACVHEREERAAGAGDDRRPARVAWNRAVSASLLPCHGCRSGPAWR